jgi:hypothetical protein
MVVLNALFDLNQDVAEGAFKAALDDFCRHLQREGYVLSWRWMQQIQPSGPSFPRPTQQQFVVRRARLAAMSMSPRTENLSVPRTGL